MKARTALSTALLSAAGLLFLHAAPASAVVYCRTVGVPKGCVARPVAPAARAAVHCTRPGYPAGCVPGAGAPGVGVLPGAGAGAAGVGLAPGRGVGANAGGPVNRVGIR
ncbi:hypothetical protein EZH22_06640 [Xanthobacter dioxanivorans]|uniref:Uncharacterized protein n=1 Tax=Xanthobacter dioxanivorans TaxID=2528964 RepID=A0A974SJQ1_9HYPH|nr:hypothetical protein [Xanthobacter dioxanivorans]QRG08020.1 hypothetical protein EZH22_06640 [Xanthobacter dioxanivorans]